MRCKAARIAPNLIIFFGVSMDALKQGADALFILLGAIMVLAMHAGFAFWNWAPSGARTRSMPQKILVDFSVSTVVYFAVGYGVAYGTTSL